VSGSKKNPAAVQLGRLRAAKLTPEERVALGRRGGKKRARNLTPEERTAIAKKAAEARWKTK
jgi:hypothetical protein